MLDRPNETTNITSAPTRSPPCIVEENGRMRESPKDSANITAASLHFQILLAGTVIFLIALFWLTDFLGGAGASRFVIGIQVVGCYVAFVSVVIGHKVLASAGKKNDPTPKG